MTAIRVLVADDDPEVREALMDLLGQGGDLEVVGVAQDAQEAIDLASFHHPDVALLDVKMPGGGGEGAARGIRAVSPATALVALSVYGDEATIAGMLEQEIRGYVLKAAPAEEILAAVRVAAGGGVAFSPEVAATLAAGLSSRVRAEHEELEHRRRWEQRIQAVLGGDGFLEMVFQPIVELERGRRVGVEALARFGDLPGVGPEAWFRGAAATGLAPELELAAIQMALPALDALPPGEFVSFNASPGTVTSPRFAAALAGFPPERMVVELTERARVHDYPALKAALGSLRAQGVRVAIDDTGAGYASLRHVLQLSPDLIKLDVELTREVDTDRAQQAMAAAIVAFGEKVGAGVIAEGIETEAQRACLSAIGVGLGQGFLLGRPGALA